jgi:hypothetical protein
MPMSVPGRKAPAGAGRVRRWLVTVVVSVVVVLLTLVVISLSVGTSLPQTSLYDFLPVRASDPRKLPSSVQHADGVKNGAIDAPLHGEGGREPLVLQNGQGGDVNSSELSTPTETIVSKVPDPVAASATKATSDEFSSGGSQKAEQGEVSVHLSDISVLYSILQT